MSKENIIKCNQLQGQLEELGRRRKSLMAQVNLIDCVCKALIGNGVDEIIRSEMSENMTEDSFQNACDALTRVAGTFAGVNAKKKERRV